MTFINERVRGLGDGGGLLDKSVDTVLDVSEWPTSSLVEDKEFSLRSGYIPESVSLAHAKHARFHINVMLMCLWVMKETSQRGPVILGYERERQHEEFKAFPIKLISLVGLQPPTPQREKPPAFAIAELKLPSHFGVGGLKWACSVCFFFFWAFFPEEGVE